MILDEADTIILKDLEGFMLNTTYKNLNVIGLTATAYGGKSTGIEANALEMMGYKIYKNNIVAKVEEPELNGRRLLNSTEKSSQYSSMQLENLT